MHFYSFHMGDYAKDTRHLSWDEDMAYRRLLDVYYAKEERLPVDERSVHRLVCAQTELQREAVNVVLNEFFVLTETGWKNDRADAEIATYHATSAKRSASAKKRWEANAMQTESKSNAIASDEPCKSIDSENRCNATNNHKPITINQEPITKKNIATKVASPDGVPASLWDDFLAVRKGKKLAVTKTAVDGLVREAEKAGISISEVLTICCQRGWGSFKASWDWQDIPKQSNQQKKTQHQLNGESTLRTMFPTMYSTQTTAIEGEVIHDTTTTTRLLG